MTLPWNTALTAQNPSATQAQKLGAAVSPVSSWKTMMAAGLCNATEPLRNPAAFVNTKIQPLAVGGLGYSLLLALRTPVGAAQSTALQVMVFGIDADGGAIILKSKAGNFIASIGFTTNVAVIGDGSVRHSVADDQIFDLQGSQWAAAIPTQALITSTSGDAALCVLEGKVI